MTRYRVREQFAFFGPKHVKDTDKDIYLGGAIIDIPPELIKGQEWKLEEVPHDKKTDTVVRVINKPIENRAVVSAPVAKTEQMRPPITPKPEPVKPNTPKPAAKKPAGKVVRVK